MVYSQFRKKNVQIITTRQPISTGFEQIKKIGVFVNINNAYPTTFGMKISPQLKTELKDSIPQNDLKKINKLIVDKRTNIEQIGSDSFI